MPHDSPRPRDHGVSWGLLRLRGRCGMTRQDNARTGCGWVASLQAKRRAEEVVTSAFLQAMAEYDIPPHPGGDCPAPDCPCERLGDQIEARAVEIAAAELGIPAAELG